MSAAPGPQHEPAGITPGDGSDGPVLRLLSGALQLWLRQQCERADSLEIALQGSAWSLLRGRLAGVRVRARGVRYQNLQLELVDLTSGPLRIQMGNLWQRKALELQHAFTIRGLVSFTSAGLNHSLAEPRWRSLADQLAEELLGITPLVGLRLGDNNLVLAAQGVGAAGPVEQATTIEASEGGLELVTLDGTQRTLLPLDASLRVEQATVEAGMLVLAGEATVTP